MQVQARPKIEKIQIGTSSSVSSKSLKKATGKNWDEWIKILDKAGAKHFSHAEIVRVLTKKKLSTWWRQWVAIGYQVHSGLRIPGQNLKGHYSLVVTKTVRVDAKTAWKFLTSAKGLAIWLQPLSEFKVVPKASFESVGGYFGEVRTVKKNSRIRFTFQDPDWDFSTVLQLQVFSKSKSTTMLAIQHEKLPSAKLKSEFRGRWREAIEQLAIEFEKTQPRRKISAQ